MCHFEEILTCINKQKINFILQGFPEILHRYCKLVALGYFGPSKAWQKYARQQVYNIFEISQENLEGWSWFFAYWYTSKFLQSDTIFLDVRNEVAQITQNDKFAISGQYLKKGVSERVDFLHADKHESLLQIDTMILIGMVKHSRSSQNSKFPMSLQYLKKEFRDKIDFLHADKHRSFLQVNFNTLGSNVSYKMILSLLMSMIKHSQSTQYNKFSISLEHLKNEIRNRVHF